MREKAVETLLIHGKEPGLVIPVPARLMDDERLQFGVSSCLTNGRDRMGRLARIALLVLFLVGVARAEDAPKPSPADAQAQSGLSKLAADWKKARASIDTQFPKMVAYAADNGFEWWPSVNPNYESVARRSEGHMKERAATLPNHLAIGENLAVEKVNCYQCHFRLGTPPPADPIAWAPDFSRVAERLREDWTKRWLINPGVIYPGTSMPQNFADNASDYHDAYPDSTSDQQIETVRARHVVVADDGRDVVAPLEQRGRLGRVVGMDQVVRLTPQGSLERLVNRLLVVDDQQRLLGLRHWSLPLWSGP